MNKTIIKNIALNIREQLINGIIEKISYLNVELSDSDDVKILTKNSEEIDSKDKNNFNEYSNYNGKEILNKIKEKGVEVLIEETAYMWFVRLITIRFMEVNKYICCNLKDFMFSKSTFIKLCNYLAETMPIVFEKVEDHMYLLLPDNMFGESSIVADLIEGIEEDYWKMELPKEKEGLKENIETGNIVEEHGIEIIGWLYQYYFSVKKDEIYSELKKEKLTRDSIPAATQIFTPKWIVQYMVENTLGKLWLESYPNEKLISQWKYFIKDTKQEIEVKKKLEELREGNLNPEEIKILDPAMGTGHILAYAFDVLYDIYLSYGYKEEDIVLCILEKNLYGLDIDDKVSKLAAFALLMKARSKNVNILDYKPRLNLVSIQESNGITKEKIDYFLKKNQFNFKESVFRVGIEYLIDIFQDAKEYGALINVKPIDFDVLEKGLEEIRSLAGLNLFKFQYGEAILEKLSLLIKQGRIMSNKYDVVVANPPYGGLRRFNTKLKRFVEKNYEDYKYDLFSVFIIKNMGFTRDNGIAGFMTPNVWQFISSYENLRNHIIDNYQLLSLIQLEDDGFKDASVAISTFVIRKCNASLRSTFIKLHNKDDHQAKRVAKIILKNSSNKFYVDQSRFKRIPGSKIGFWVGENTIKTFESGKRLEEIAKPRQGMATSNNNRFLRYWYEVNFEEICFTSENSNIGNYKWVPYNKGGGYRKWYGNNSFIVNWQNDGYEVKEYAKKLYGNYTRTIKNENFYFKEGITYTFIGKNISPRFSPKGFIFDVAGSMIFVEKNKFYYILGLLASKLSKHYMEFLNPSLNIQVGDIKSIPVIEVRNTSLLHKIDKLVMENIKIAKSNWDSFETSWDFKKHPILNYKFKEETIKEAYKNWARFSDIQFSKLKENEEQLNSIFINIYGLEDELTPEIEDKDVTISKADEIRDIKSFISYFVGCMFGRYSLEEEGLIYAGGNFDYKFKFENKSWWINTKEGWNKSSIDIVSNNIIPVNENKDTKDDIVNRFIDFIKIVFGEETLEENLNYIAKVLDGKSTKYARNIIRHYFLQDFFTDHLQTYNKRPIYWLIDSQGRTESKFLIYIHRHNEVNIDKIKNLNLDEGIKLNYEKIIND